MNEQGNDKKTYKREVALLLFIWLVYLVETKEPELVQILAFPVFTFGALAFGLQWYSPNGGLLKPQSTGSTNRGRPQRSSEHTSRKDQQPNHWHIERHRAENSTTQGSEDNSKL